MTNNSNRPERSSPRHRRPQRGSDGARHRRSIGVSRRTSDPSWSGLKVSLDAAVGKPAELDRLRSQQPSPGISALGVPIIKDVQIATPATGFDRMETIFSRFDRDCEGDVGFNGDSTGVMQSTQPCEHSIAELGSQFGAE